MRTQRVAAVLILGVAACRPSPLPPDGSGAPERLPAPGPEVIRPALPLDEVASALTLLLADPAPLPGLRRSPDEAKAVSALYEASGGGLLWLTEGGLPRAAASEAITLLLGSDSEGLHPQDYVADVLDSAADQIGAGGTGAAATAARFDVGLSLAMLRYLGHLHSGRVDPRDVGFEMASPADRHDLVALLGNALATGAIFEVAADLAPPLRQYALVRRARERYRALAADETTDPVRLDLVARPGDTVPGLSDLVGRLVANGDLADPTPDTAAYGPGLEAAVRRFQARHGLDPDGVVGRETVAELNVRLDWRVQQLELTLERLRWLPDLSQGRFLLVNIPMFELFAFDSIGPGSVPSFRTGVIVGQALDTQTPILVEDMRYVIFQPYWNVPPSILRGEILPALRRDATYLTRNDMEIVQGPGDDAAALAQSPENLARLARGLLRVRQRPGPLNALGRVKFMFPNDRNVYLHGTPAEALFSRTRRDFSHGCVRVERPDSLAAWVLRDLPDWDPGRIREAMTTGPQSRRVDLPRAIPVLLFYTTAAVMPDGVVRFARDIYGHDRRLDAALHAARGP